MTELQFVELKNKRNLLGYVTPILTIMILLATLWVGWEVRRLDDIGRWTAEAGPGIMVVSPG